MHFSHLTPKERDKVILDILKGQFPTTNQGKERWEKGWEENLQTFNSSNNINDLTPKYIRPNQVIRFFREFVRPEDPEFERKWYEKFRANYFREYLAGYDNIFEFGCGSGYNIPVLQKLFPNSVIHGLDWVQASVDIVNKLGAKGHLFDFFNPDYSLEIPPNSAFLTVGAIEQTGTRWKPLVDFVMQKKPARVCHSEPVYEWYDHNHLVDYTAMVAHEKRDFCRGYWPYLLELKKNELINIRLAQRNNVGSLIIEGYSQIVFDIVKD